MLLEEVVETHEMLAEILKSRNIDVSQSTLSKDLRELGVVRMPRPDGGFRYNLPEVGATLRDQHILERELRDYVTTAEQAQNIVVVKTLSGHAQSVCESIDRIGWSEIVGTIAGENTIFIVAGDALQAESVVERIGAISGDSV